MPRQARLDAPGTLHHVIIGGLERGAIVKDDVDREAFVTRPEVKGMLFLSLLSVLLRTGCPASILLRPSS